MHESTFHGLHHWHQRMFEKLGWVILAKEYGNMDKVKCYINGVNHLEESISQKILRTNDQYKIRDLKILLQNVNILQHYVNQIFSNQSVSGPRR